MTTNDCSVDELDLAILTHLQADGRKSFTEIAEALGVSVGTIRNRLSRMVEDETVQIIGRVNPHRVGFNAPATINVAVQPSHLEAAVAQIAEFPEVSWLAMVTGPYDLVVDVMCRDVGHLSDLIIQRLHKVAGVTRTEVAYVLRIHKTAQPDLNLVHPTRQKENALSGARQPVTPTTPYRR